MNYWSAVPNPKEEVGRLEPALALHPVGRPCSGLRPRHANWRRFTGGDPAAAVTLVGPTPSPFQIGGLIGGAIAFFISDGTEENPNAGLLFGDG